MYIVYFESSRLTHKLAHFDPGSTTVLSGGESWASEYFTCLISVTHVNAKVAAAPAGIPIKPLSVC